MHKTICITGATGFLASHLICKLLPYNTLHVITRDKSKFVSNFLPQIKHIGHISSLKIFESDYTSEDTIFNALNGCDYLIHCASPVILKPYIDIESNLKYIINPALQITENVLNCVSKTSISMVLYTSSTSSIYSTGKKTMNKYDWADESLADPYTLSKILSEKRAWELSKGAKWKLIVTLPGRIIGPIIYNTVPESYISITEIINNTKPDLINYHSSFCDVRDVCNIYANFITNPPESDRYVISFDTLPLSEYYNVIKLLKPIGPVNFIDADDYFIYDNSDITKIYSENPICFAESVKDSIMSMDKK